MDEAERKVTVLAPIRLYRDCAVGIYARVSTSHRDQMISLSAQLSGLARMVASTKGWYVADIFLDIESAGQGSERPEFQRMISECERHNINTVITKSMSRFSRDAEECINTVQRLRKADVNVVFVQDKLDTASVSDDVLMSAKAACDQAENEWRSENIRLGLMMKAQAGTSGVYSRKCFGYRKNKAGLLEVDDKEAETVRKIYDWYLSGFSVTGIIKQLKEHNIKSPSGKDTWSKRGVESILTREKYTGDATAFTGNVGYRKNGSNPAIIERAQFEQVQKEMAARTNIEAGEDGQVRRKKTKYSSKKKK